ncbi:MAG TPA: aminotransferase class I/II-fold pyridoxal phosphate-dependent enzyme [Acidimicrobiales bacterium]|nr:aminotransferase class I/II-fold pyridoxal phosphate-dependent enzyme [Acidimicrobiales bacterium]
MSAPAPFEVPVYPFDRLAPLAALAQALPGGLVDLSVGTPCDPPPAAVVDALADPVSARGYPAGVGSPRVLDAARGWLERRFGVSLERGQLAACVGTKELVAGVPHWLRLRAPERDTVLYPAVSYPTYAMGAELARCRAVPVPAREDGTMDLDSIAARDAERALCLWLNSPSNPTGALDDLAAAASWGRARGVPVLSDECYAEFTWDGPPRTILATGLEGVLAIHSISKRSNAAGLRFGFYAGDPDLVGFLSELRRHAGFMVPGPVQAAAAVALDDDAHVELQRERYRRRLERVVAILAALGVPARLPAGGFYLWVAAPEAAGGSEDPAWSFARRLAERAGALVSPGEFYGRSAARYVRLAVVQPDERIELVARRLGVD